MKIKKYIALAKIEVAILNSNRCGITDLAGVWVKLPPNVPSTAPGNETRERRQFADIDNSSYLPYLTVFLNHSVEMLFVSRCTNKRCLSKPSFLSRSRQVVTARHFAYMKYRLYGYLLPRIWSPYGTFMYFFLFFQCRLGFYRVITINL